MRELPGLCDVPLAGRGCDLVMDAAQAVGEGIARELSAGFAEAAKLALASWTTVGLPDVSGPVGQMHSSLWLTGSLAVLSLLDAAARLMLERKSGGAVAAGRTLVAVLADVPGGAGGGAARAGGRRLLHLDPGPGGRSGAGRPPRHAVAQPRHARHRPTAAGRPALQRVCGWLLAALL